MKNPTIIRRIRTEVDWSILYPDEDTFKVSGVYRIKISNLLDNKCWFDNIDNIVFEERGRHWAIPPLKFH